MDDDLEPLRLALRDDAAGVAEALLGPRNAGLSTRTMHRWGRKGSLKIEVAGPTRGLWFDHEAGEGGDLFDLIQRACNCNFQSALAWARRHLGFAEYTAGLVRRPCFATPKLAPNGAKEAKAAHEAAAEADDIARRIRRACSFVDGTVPLAGTLGEDYFTRTRGIRCPADGWPASIRWRPASRAILAVVTQLDGTVTAVQRIHIDGRAWKIGREELVRRGLPAVKVTDGVLKGGAVCLPGDPNGPLLLAEGVESGLAAYTTGHETWVALGSVARLEPATGRVVLVIADDNPPAEDAKNGGAARALAKAVKEWRLRGATVSVVYPWPTRRHDKTDFADLILAEGPDAVARRITPALAAAERLAMVPDGPHYPRGSQRSGKAAGARLRRVMRAFLGRIERDLAVRDWIAEEAARILPDIREQAERRILVRLLKKPPTFDVFDLNPPEPSTLAAARAARVAGRLARNVARRAAVAIFGRGAANNAMPRRQIKGVAGLGKTQAFIAEYLRRPTLWKRNIETYVPTIELAEKFVAKLLAAAQTVPLADDGSRPRIVLIQQRGAKGMCDRERLQIVNAALEAKVESVFRTCCFRPAQEGRPESSCAFYRSCGYVAQFDDRPALRVMPHARLKFQLPNQLPLPEPDLVMIDETVVGALTGCDVIDPSVLTDCTTYAAPFGEDARIGEATETGRIVIGVLSSGDASILVLVAAGVTAQSLYKAAKAASLAATRAQPAVHPGMNPTEAEATLRAYTPHPGREVAGMLRQLAHDIEAGRKNSVGVEWDAEHMVTLPDGKRVPHPVILYHRINQTPRLPEEGALLLLDADADLGINRRLFGPSLRGVAITAARVANVTQIHDAVLPKSTLAPRSGLPKNVDKAEQLRAEIAKFVASQVALGKRVLVVTPLQVRLALTNEVASRISPTTKWNGADVIHYGRHLGVDDFRHHDVVILVGREQLPPVQAERMARGLYGDDPTATLSLTGQYGYEFRRHDLRVGLAPPIKVQVHLDPRVQAIVELSREDALGQALDRLRLIHRDVTNPATVIVLTNLVIPSLIVDELLRLKDALNGGSVWERALGRCGGVLPLSARWLSEHLPDLFPSHRSAARATADLKGPGGELKVPSCNKNMYCRMAVYRLPGQKRPSTALVRQDIADPEAALCHLLKCAALAEYRAYGRDYSLATQQAGGSQVPDVAAAREVPPDSTEDHMAANDRVVQVVPDGYGPLLAPVRLCPGPRAPDPPTILLYLKEGGRRQSIWGYGRMSRSARLPVAASH